MVEFNFSCPQCRQNIQGDTGYIGSRINCPARQQSIIVPTVTGSSPHKRISLDRRRGVCAAVPERQASEEAGAEGLVRDELRRLGWKEEQLRMRRKGDGDKAALARWRRAETPMT